VSETLGRRDASTPAGPATAEPPVELPLAGYTVAVTAARRKEELGALLDRRGARVVYAPAIRIVPLADDAELVTATRTVLDHPIDLVVATTGVGFRGWLEAADAWDLPLVDHLRSARVLARGPKARGAIRGAGLVDAWSPESESSGEVLSHLLSGAEGRLEGRRIAVQLHGDPLPDLVAGLRAAGAEVLTVPVYRWVLPEDVVPVHRLVASVIAGGVDAVTFTSAPAAASLLAVAEEDGKREELVAAFNGRVLSTRPASRPSSRSAPASVLWPAKWWPGCLSGTRCWSSGRTRCRFADTPSCWTAGSSSWPPGRWRSCASWPAVPATSSPGRT
jgi:uroporphyrinogen-III synthase